jgi:hypothetical protein
MVNFLTLQRCEVANMSSNVLSVSVRGLCVPQRTPEEIKVNNTLHREGHGLKWAGKVKSRDAVGGVTHGYHSLHPPGPQEINELILKHVNTRKLQLCWLGSMPLGWRTVMFHLCHVNILLYNFDGNISIKFCRRLV